MLGFFFFFCADIIFGPTIDAMIGGLTFGMTSNILNNGQLLWNTDK